MSILKNITNTKVALLICLAITLIAFWQTLYMYFWIDDNAVIYKLQHLEQNIGFWGKGIVGSGPYRHIIDQFIPFYPFFKTNPTPYYAVGILLYFLTSVSIYFFVRFITKNKLLAFASALIFSAGYVGSDSIYGITNSWATLRGIIMSLVAFGLYYKYLNSKEMKWYIFSVVLFFFSLDTVYIRSHGLIFAIAAFDFLYSPVKFKIESIVKFLLRLVPFSYIHYYIYLTSLAYAKGFGILGLFSQIFQEGKYYLLSIPIQDIGNLFIPDLFSKKLDILVRDYVFLHNEVSLFSLIFGLVFIITTLFLVARNLKKQKEITTIFIFSVVWIISNFIIFYLRETNHTLWTTHRYFTYSFVGLATYWASGLSLILDKKKNLYLLSIGIIALCYMLLSVVHQKEFNDKRSFPAKKFFSAFDSFVPEIPKDSVLYFSIENNNKIKDQFGGFFGGMFSEGSNLAIYTEGIDYMNEFTFTYKFDDILSFLAEGKTSLDKVYTFYYGKDGLVETTDVTREFLFNGKQVSVSPADLSSITSYQVLGNAFQTNTDIYQENGIWVGKYPSVTVTPNESISVVPSKFEFSMKVTPKTVPIPFQSGEEVYNITPQERLKVFDYLQSVKNFRESAKATSGSFWKEQEAKFAVDGRLDTAWRGHRGYWDDIYRGNTNNIEYLNIDLGSQKLISQVVLTTAQRPLVPSDYRILISLDGTNWIKVFEETNGSTYPEGTSVTNSFNPVQARFVRLEVLKTFGNDGPELKEFEVVESKFANLDREVLTNVKNSPYNKIESVTDFNSALSYISKNAAVRFYWRSQGEDDQDPNNFIEIPIKPDGNTYIYEVNLPSTGVFWKNFTVEGFNFPAEVSISNITIDYKRLNKNKLHLKR